MTNTITRPLSNIATDINSTHDAAVSHASQAIHLARRCGQLLLEAKSQLGHGSWLPWLTENCRVSARQASNYMRVALNWDALPHNEDLTIKGAVAHLVKPVFKSAPGSDLPDCHMSIRSRIHDLDAQEIKEVRAVGALLNWASKRGKPRFHSFEWLADLSEAESDKLLEALGPDGLLTMHQLVDRVAAHYGLSFTPFPDAWIIAIYREQGTKEMQSLADGMAADLQSRLDSAGLGHDRMEERRAEIEATHSMFAVKAGCTLDEPNEAFMQAVCDSMFVCTHAQS
jgi:hypothetical protein